MSETEPGADELRMRAILKQRGVGPDAQAPHLPPTRPPGFEPAVRAADWWEPKTPVVEADTSEEPEDDEPEAAVEEEPRTRAFAPQPGYWPHPHLPAAVTSSRERAAAAISPGTRRLLYNASAAGAGWGLGLYGKFAWALTDCGEQSISGALVLGIGGTALIAHLWDRRTRHWWPGIAWAARIPLATAVLALALWAPAAP